LVGLTSFLLVSFWYTRLETNLGAVLAIVMNRVGDVFFLLGIFLSLLLLGSSDVLILISSFNYLNSDLLLISFFIAAMAKSAQLYLHLWLPFSMEGKLQKKDNIPKIFLFKGLRSYSTGPKNPILRNSKGQFIKGSHNIKKDRDIRITDFQKQVIIGLLLSDGYLKDRFMAFTFKSDHLLFIRWLKFDILGSICSKKEPNSYPKINPTQYTFNTLSFHYLEQLRLKWYTPKKFIPLDLHLYFTKISLAFLLMGDGYWDNHHKTIYICTESFTPNEIDYLISILDHNFGLIATKSKRNSSYRIRFSSKKANLQLLRSLVLPYFHPIMIYKLGLS
jgi:hypothetical protein